MQLRITGGICDNPTTPTTCDVGLGNSFSLFVDLAKVPSGGYMGFQTEIDYDGLTYLPGPDAGSEIPWPDSAFPLRSPQNPTGTEGLVNHASSTSPPSFPVSSYDGAMLEIELECTSTTSTQTIALVPYGAGNADATAIAVPPSFTVVPLSDSLTIECQSGIPTFTPIMLRAGQHVVWTCQPGEPHYHSLLYHYAWGDSGSSTGTSIPPPMELYQEPSPALEGLECWHGGTGTRVWYYLITWIDPNDIKGTVVDSVSGIPIGGTVTLQKDVGGSWVNVTNPGELEPDANPTFAVKPGLFGWDVAPGPQYRVTASRGGCTTNDSGPLTPPATNIVIEIACNDSDGDGLPDAADNISIYDNFTTETITLPDDPDTDGDTVPDGADDCDGDGYSNLVELRDYRSNPCDYEAYDGDEDGCSDMEELRANEALGGRRDSRNPWDFFDPNGDGTVDLLNDIFAVAGAFGLTPADGGYSTALDRSAAAPGGDAWDLGAPDGTVDLLTDIFGVAKQFGQDCTAAP